jgi:hypothetical protein
LIQYADNTTTQIVVITIENTKWRRCKSARYQKWGQTWKWRNCQRRQWCHRSQDERKNCHQPDTVWMINSWNWRRNNQKQHRI